MNGFLKIAKTTEITPGNIKKFELNGASIAIANVNGQYYAINDTCTHQQCSLSDGEIDGQNIVCPCHGGQFDLKTGAVKVPPPTQGEQVYEVKIENDDIYIKI